MATAERLRSCPRDRAVQFFEALYASLEPEKGWCVEVRGIDLTGGMRSVSRWFPMRGSHLEVVGYAGKVNAEGMDSFYQVNPTPHGCQGDDDVLAGVALWADIDGIASIGEAEERLSAILETPLAPDAAVFTGGGLHVYHFLKEPYDPAQSDWSLYLKALRATAAQYGGDKKCVNPARVLRVPGSISHKRNTETRLWLR